jgi:hypothetical protein
MVMRGFLTFVVPSPYLLPVSLDWQEHGTKMAGIWCENFISHFHRDFLPAPGLMQVLQRV